MHNSYRLNPHKPYFMEKLVSALSYLTMGFVGFFYILLTVVTKKRLGQFLKYHVFQSIFISIGYFLLTQFVTLICNLLSMIPFINKLVLIVIFYTNMPLLFGFSLIQMCVYSVLIYLIITTFQGKYSYLPWVSNIIKSNVR